MNARMRPFVRSVLFALLAAGLAGCHYHRGYCGGWSHHNYCAPVPMRCCR